MLVGLGVLLVLGVLAASAFTAGGGAATTPTDTTPTVSLPTDTTPTGTTASTPTATTPTVSTPTVSTPTVTTPTVTATRPVPTTTTPVRPRRPPRETPPPVRPPVTAPVTSPVTTQVTQPAIPPVSTSVQVVATVATKATNTVSQPLESSGAATPLASGPAAASAAPAVAVAAQAADTPRAKARLRATKVEAAVGTAKATFRTDEIATSTRSTRKTGASGRGLQASRTATQGQDPPPPGRTKPASHIVRPAPGDTAPRLSSSSSSPSVALAGRSQRGPCLEPGLTGHTDAGSGEGGHRRDELVDLGAHLFAPGTGRSRRRSRRSRPEACRTAPPPPRVARYTEPA